MDIPTDNLSSEALRGIIEAFILREGTDYGHQDYSLNQKLEAVKLALHRGEAKIVYDDNTETCNIVLTSESGV